MQSISAEPYNKRPVPSPTGAATPSDLQTWAKKIAAFLNFEFGNVQRGSARATSKTVTANTLLTPFDGLVLVDATGGNISVTLPTPEDQRDTVITVKRIDASGHTVTIVGTIDGAVNPTLAAQWKSKTMWAHVPASGAGSWFTVASV